MARRVIYRRSGRPAEVLSVAETPKPRSPRTGEILVRVTAFPVHAGDLRGIERGRPSGEVTPGLEATGVVADIGPGTSVGEGVGPGARVTFFPVPGAWQEFVHVRADLAVPVPPEIGPELAPQLLCNPLTAQSLLRAAGLGAFAGAEHVLVQAAAGSAVGRLLAVLATSRGAVMVNVVRSDEGAAALRDWFPGGSVVSAASPGWPAAIRAHAGNRPLLAGFDPVGGAMGRELLRLLSPGGTLVSYGALDSAPIPVDPLVLLSGDLRVRGMAITNWLTLNSPAQRARDVAGALALAAREPRQFPVAGRYPLSELAAAVEHAARPRKNGTVLVEIS
jgi:NADPH:quinone reductase-like Zn-dependent oxidoreductase